MTLNVATIVAISVRRTIFAKDPYLLYHFPRKNLKNYVTNKATDLLNELGCLRVFEDGIFPCFSYLERAKWLELLQGSQTRK